MATAASARDTRTTPFPGNVCRAGEGEGRLKDTVGNPEREWVPEDWKGSRQSLKEPKGQTRGDRTEATPAEVLRRERTRSPTVTGAQARCQSSRAVRKEE